MAKSHRSSFQHELSARATDPEGRRWVFVPYDQLSGSIGPLSRFDPGELGIVLVECPAKAARRPYHKHKLALVLANQRQFALEQAGRGVAVEHLVSAGSYSDALRTFARTKGPLSCMRPAEFELRADLASLVKEGGIEYVPHEGWLTTRDQFRDSQKGKSTWRMDAFYRTVRRDSGLLMDSAGKPIGGKFSFDAENREPWKGDPPAAEVPKLRPDAVTKEVIDLVNERFASHPGEIDPDSLPATRDEAEALWEWAKRDCLPFFGPYEDAMSTRSRTVFHTRLSALVNIHRLLPRVLVEETCALDVELRCKEGFVRQILGWREFMRHVHEETDGFRNLHGSKTPASKSASPSFLGAKGKLPEAFWGKASGLACLDKVVDSVWDEAYSHHITRLMILANIATLLDVSPRELTDWFWVAYADAYDWVVEPNVLAMGTFAVGDLLTTKPYVSGAAYIDRMSDYCKSCELHPKKTCPITPMYWAFLDRHGDILRENQRMKIPYASLGKRAEEKSKADARSFDYVRKTLAKGQSVDPEQMKKILAPPSK